MLSCKVDEGCLRKPKLGPSRDRCRGLMTGARRVVGDASGQVNGTGPVGEVAVGVADVDPVGVAFGETAGSLEDGNGICASLTGFEEVAALPVFNSSSPSDDDVPVNALFDSEGIIIVSPSCWSRARASSIFCTFCCFILRLRSCSAFSRSSCSRIRAAYFARLSDTLSIGSAEEDSDGLTRVASLVVLAELSLLAFDSLKPRGALMLDARGNACRP